jgi:hypothetical protein
MPIHAARSRSVCFHHTIYDLFTTPDRSGSTEDKVQFNMQSSREKSYSSPRSGTMIALKTCSRLISYSVRQNCSATVQCYTITDVVTLISPSVVAIVTPASHLSANIACGITWLSDVQLWGRISSKEMHLQRRTIT